MKTDDLPPFLSARDELQVAQAVPRTAQTCAPSYQLAFVDPEFIVRDELRAVRLQMELLKAELVQQEQGVDSTIVVFGSARIAAPEVAAAELERARRAWAAEPDRDDLAHAVRVRERIQAKARYYDEARRFSEIVSGQSTGTRLGRLAIATGGGPGIMEAANRGAYESGGLSVGLNIVLPAEQIPNAFITPELCFQFHYFAIRKMHFLLRAKALVAFPGGFGTLDELFETLTLIQTKKIRPVPVILFGREYWSKIVNFHALVEEGAIGADDLRLFEFADRAEEAWAAILRFYHLDGDTKKGGGERS